MSQRRWFQVSTTVCGHSIHFRSDRCGQIRTAELSEKASIGRANPRHRSRAEWIGITEIKIEKGAILSHLRVSDVEYIRCYYVRGMSSLNVSIL
jgi:hypothetical protein